MGLATARELILRHPSLSFVLLEKEKELCEWSVVDVKTRNNMLMLRFVFSTNLYIFDPLTDTLKLDSPFPLVTVSLIIKCPGEQSQNIVKM